MEAVRPIWTDERMDDLSHKVDELGRRMDDGFKELRTEMRAEFRAVRSEAVALRTEMNARFDSLQRAMLGMMGTMVLGFASILATQL